MAFLWLQRVGQLTAVAIDANRVISLFDAGDGPEVRRGRGEDPAGLLLRFRDRWCLLGQSGNTRLNQLPTLGLAILRHGDEINIGGNSVIFSSESLARVFLHSSAPCRCARCQGDIEPGVHSVIACPACGAVHHQHGDELPCFTGGAADKGCCARCRTVSALGDRPLQLPEGLP